MTMQMYDRHMRRDLEREGWREGKGGSYRDAYATKMNPLYMEYFLGNFLVL